MHCSKYFIIQRNIFRFLFHGNSSGQEIKGRMQTLKFFQKTFVKNAKTFNCIFFCRIMLTIFYEGIVIKWELRDVWTKLKHVISKHQDTRLSGTKKTCLISRTRYYEFFWVLLSPMSGKANILIFHPKCWSRCHSKL